MPITAAGAYAFYVSYSPVPEFSTEVRPPEGRVQTPLHYFNVAPNVKLNGHSLTLESLSSITAISKFMGRFPDDWYRHLRHIGRRGYNMVHFTPLMQRGKSDSPFSIYDQLTFDPSIFPSGERDVARMLERMEEEYGLLALTDVVWNHTAHNSKWLQEHPEAGYNVATAPWLQSALELDDALLEYSRSLGMIGLPVELNTHDNLLAIMQGMREHVIDKVRLWEFYPVDIASTRDAILDIYKQGAGEIPTLSGFDGDVKSWDLVQRAEYLRQAGLSNRTLLTERYGRKLDPQVGAALLSAIYGTYNDQSLSTVKDDLSKLLDEVNLPLFQEFDNDVIEIFSQLYNRMKYLFLDDHGPKLGPVTETNPLVETYFTRLPLNETTKRHDLKYLNLVNNGWAWNANAMRDNAGPHSRAYLLRQMIVWGDCVKLHYGQKYDDNPYLWDYMIKYTRLMAKYFSAFRIDNCHSTPLHVAERLLHEARSVRPDLIVFAELFTGNEQDDYLFAKRLGLNALIREAMQSWSPDELSRLVHRHGGRPIGSFDTDFPRDPFQTKSGDYVKRISSNSINALFMDCTHDNEMPTQKREARDTLPNAALVSMCASATGSVVGYDDIYPEHVNVVSETRPYAVPSEKDLNFVGPGGIGGLKALLNRYHTMMAINGYDETHVHHDGPFISVHRVDPISRKGVLLITHTAFPGNGFGTPAPVHLGFAKTELMGAWRLEVDDRPQTRELVFGNKHFLTGLPSATVEIAGVTVTAEGNGSVIRLPDEFCPGSIALFETSMLTIESSEKLAVFLSTGAEKACASLDLVEINYVLYRCEAEERDSTNGLDGVYNIPGFGPLVYAGLQGWWSLLEDIIKYNDMGHPLSQHLRKGKWALDYIIRRMEHGIVKQGFTHLQPLADWLRSRVDVIRDMPFFLLPRCFATIVQTAFYAVWTRAISLLSDHIQPCQPIIQQLAMVSVQQVGIVQSASLYPTKQVPSMAAGLPHFATDWARCWGRDIFIALRGLLLCTGRYDVAKEHILAFASVLKHGMVPNLLSSGKMPRYNSRDSVWFFLQAIQDYADVVPDGISILKERVARRFLPYDDTWFPYDDERAYSQSSTVADIIQEVFQRHAWGLSFREWNAGPELDRQMKQEGFQIDVHVDWTNGLIFGGNQWNCGTWQDKMGESELAGNKGFPGTPRDGAAIEITGLLFSALRWVSSLCEANLYEPDGVEMGTYGGKKIGFGAWAELIQTNFERCYHVPLSSADDAHYDLDPRIVNHRGIYKDLYRSGKSYEDYQLRPNFAIALTVAPSLFKYPQRALHALALADKVLRGPLGMATLDPSDMAYRPDYDNGADSTDFATAKGRNYHQGPEWLWPTGYFLRALLRFDLARRQSADERTETFQLLTRRLLGCKKALARSPWKGLTELTNGCGKFCHDSVSTVFMSDHKEFY